MDKLSKHDFALTSKHELWNRIKDLEKEIESLRLTIRCIDGAYDELQLETWDLREKLQFLKNENNQLRSHNYYLLSQLSGQSIHTINFN